MMGFPMPLEYVFKGGVTTNSEPVGIPVRLVLQLGSNQSISFVLLAQIIGHFVGNTLELPARHHFCEIAFFVFGYDNDALAPAYHVCNEI
jgi:hypothetical protein